MTIQIFRPTRPKPPVGVSRPMWEAVLNGRRHSHDGPTVTEPWVAQRLAELRVELTTMHHTDAGLATARRSFELALLDLRSANDEVRIVDTLTALPVRAGLAERRRRGDPAAGSVRAEGARADRRRTQAHDRQLQAQQKAEAANAELREVAGAVLDRMMMAAREAMPSLHQYVGLLNVDRVTAGVAPLEPLTDDIAERCVLEAQRRARVPADLPNDPAPEGGPR